MQQLAALDPDRSEPDRFKLQCKFDFLQNLNGASTKQQVPTFDARNPSLAKQVAFIPNHFCCSCDGFVSSFKISDQRLPLIYFEADTVQDRG